jgi:hypothetical protein
MEFDLQFFASLLIIGLMTAAAVAAFTRLRLVDSDGRIKVMPLSSAPALLFLGLCFLPAAEGLWLFLTYYELPKMVNESFTAESIARSTLIAQRITGAIELVAWVLILFGFLKIKRPESPA